jgi:hypothetical protein
VQSLLPKSKPRDVYDALLTSIALGYEQITAIIIQSPGYERARNAGKKMKVGEGGLV